ncbi:MAG: nitroreductase family protein [Streptococcaceae bacterium]|jgi:nitroreductase|nr:nitroreductase family protein [Streptococcaceae bacterium]
MDFVKLNKNRHAVKIFTGEKVTTSEIKQMISAAALAPSAHNMQPWHFVIVESDAAREALLTQVKPQNRQQVETAGGVVVIFSDTDLSARSNEIAHFFRDELTAEQLERFANRYPTMFQNYEPQTKSDYLAFNAGLVAINFVYTVQNHGYKTNFVLGFEKTQKINELLGVDKRYRPEIIIPFGPSEFSGVASTRLPQEKIIEIK